MSFLLIERDKKPIKWRGRKVVLSTISVLNRDALADGEYFGVKSQRRMQLIHHGGSLIAAPELRDVYHISNIMPATLDEEAAHMECGEVLAAAKDLSKIKRYLFEEYTVIEAWSDTWNPFWIPCSFSVESNTIGKGWLRVATQEMILADGFMLKPSKPIKVHLLRSVWGFKSEVWLGNLAEVSF